MRAGDFTGPAAVKDEAEWRVLINANLRRASAQRMRALFSELNPDLVGDKLFESRWSDKRREAAVLIPIVNRPEGPNVVLTVRSSDMPSHAGQVSFPGGKAHPEDESLVATALREAHEEIGLSPSCVDVVGALGVHLGGLGFAVTPVIGIVDPRAQLQACPREVAEIFETPLSFIADLHNHITEERVHEGVKYKMAAIPYGRFHIWGLTAGILHTLGEILQESE